MNPLILLQTIPFVQKKKQEGGLVGEKKLKLAVLEG